MKKTIIALLALGGIALGANDVYTLDLTAIGAACTSDDDSLVAEGITAANAYNYAPFEWNCTYQAADLAGQSTVTDNTLHLQCGNVCGLNKGNYAAIKFTTVGEALTLSFDVKFASAWGGDNSTFAVDYHCNVYGYDKEGNSTILGTWTEETNRSTIKSYGEKSYTIDLSHQDTKYDSYAVIFDATKTVAAGGGYGLNFSNIKVVAVPEPTTATLSLLALAGLAARRRRK